jgi:hypothetical protein
MKNLNLIIISFSLFLRVKEKEILDFALYVLKEQRNIYLNERGRERKRSTCDLIVEFFGKKKI